ncbi:sensor histidine kinase [Nocardioides zeae]|uniref:histidine kinase n=1 Tax=Nocardioides imazamoxiresistens TaxID=3231893 RepID=A0ABU3PTP9_9ACTN|nr:sensor histidine kinase [Nocardioides zeae]MDT9592564.1 sensor histidine kinase [Nocardioides zeae]
MARRGGPSARGRQDWSVAGQVLLLQLVVVLVLVTAAVGLAVLDARSDTRENATNRAVAVAESLADAPATVAAVASPDPTALLQTWTSTVETDADVDFVVVMSPERIRFTHPNPDQVGGRFVGDVGRALEGEVFVQEYVGTLGPSVRAVVPVFADGDGGEVVALVSVGVSVDRISDAVRGDLAAIALAAAAVLVVGVLGAAVVARRLRRQTHGMGEVEITRMYEYYAAVLGAVREGLLLVDDDGLVTLVNDEARRLLDLPADGVLGTPLRDLGLPPGLVAAVAEGRVASDDLYVTGDKVLVVSSSPAAWDDADVGSVVTLRDRTDLQAVTGELDVVRALSESLRAQNHEAANRLHTVVSLVEMGRADEAVDFATEELQVAQLLTDRVVAATGDPVLAALLLGKTAEAAERGTELQLLGGVPEQLPVGHRDIVTVVGNLVDNALDAVGAAERRVVRVTFEPRDPARLRITVEDSGPGLTQAEVAHAFERGWSTKVAPAESGGRGIGLALVAQVARRHGGDVAVGASPLGGAAFTVDLGGTA